MTMPPSARRQHDVRPERTHAIGDGSAAGFRFRRMLQHQRALQVAGTVQSGGQPEVSFEQRADAAKPIEALASVVTMSSYVHTSAMSASGGIGIRYQVSGMV